MQLKSHELSTPHNGYDFMLHLCSRNNLKIEIVCANVEDKNEKVLKYVHKYQKIMSHSIKEN